MNLKIEYANINDLKKYHKNAKKHPKEQVNRIANSIKEFGMCDPIGVWGKDNLIIEGHGRLMALKKLGYTEAPIIRLDHLSEEQRKAYTLAHNKSAESEWDFEILSDELKSIVDIDMMDFGFDLSLDEEEPKVIEDEIPEIPVEPKAKYGDIYQLGNHRLMCGDATVLEDVRTLMNDNKADLLLTDPPYNVDYEGKTKDSLKIKNDNMGDNQFKQFLTDSFSNANEVMKEGASFYIWHADSEGYNFRSACKDVSWKVRQCLIWNKNTMVMGRQDYQWKHEPCLYGWKDGASHNWYSDRKQTTVLEFNKPSKSELHPTMKPLDLFAYQMKNSTAKGDIVLDLFGGSGTTLMVSEQLDRNAYIMELDPRYVDAIINRWETMTGSKGVLLNG